MPDELMIKQHMGTHTHTCFIQIQTIPEYNYSMYYNYTPYSEIRYFYLVV